MSLVYGLGICAAVLALFQYAYQRWCLRLAYRSAVRQHGCQKVPQYSHRDSWGYDLARDRLRAFASGEGQKIYERHFEKYGKTFEEHFFFQKTLSTMDAANIQHVLSTASKDFSKHESRTRKVFIRKLIGPGIVTTEDGPKWKQSRGLIKPIFARGELADVNLIGKHVDNLITNLPRDNSTVDAQPLLQKMFLDAASDFLLGEPLDAFSKNPPTESISFIRNMDQATGGFARYRSSPRLSYLRHLLPNDYDRACKKIHNFVDVHVRRVLAKTTRCDRQSGEKPGDKVDQSQRYIFIDEVAKRIRDPYKLRSEVMNVFLVARENVAMAAANALFHLARNPSAWNSLRNEVLGLGNQPLTFELLKSLQETRNIYNETLRLQGPAIMVTRTAVRNTILPTGGGPFRNAPIFVEKGTQVIVNNWSLHHDPSIWGLDAHSFRPQRWVDRKPPGWDFVPFGGGPRICPALQQVYTYFAYLMVRLAREFETIENRDPVGNYVTSFEFTAVSKNGVKIGLAPVSG